MTIIDKRGRTISLWEKARPFLFFCSYLFSLLLAVRRCIYKSGLKKKTRLNAKTISVGNITLGGTGKTPLVEYIARMAKEKNKVAILSRGYGGGDEAELFLKRNKDIPVLAGKNRAELGREAVDKGASVIVLDDGFQHWQLERDVDIVTIDSTWPIWKDRLLPAGTLREKINNLKRAHAFVLTRVDSSKPDVKFWLEYLKNINPQAPVFLSCHRAQKFINRYGDGFPVSLIKDKKFISFSGIGRPEAFEETLKSLGGRLFRSIRYPDHYSYKARDLWEIEEIAGDVSHIVTTEKDLVRIESDILDKRLLALVVEIEFLEDKDKFFNLCNLNKSL